MPSGCQKPIAASLAPRLGNPCVDQRRELPDGGLAPVRAAVEQVATWVSIVALGKIFTGPHVVPETDQVVLPTNGGRHPQNLLATQAVKRSRSPCVRLRSSPVLFLPSRCRVASRPKNNVGGFLNAHATGTHVDGAFGTGHDRSLSVNGAVVYHVERVSVGFSLIGLTRPAENRHLGILEKTRLG